MFSVSLNSGVKWMVGGLLVLALYLSMVASGFARTDPYGKGDAKYGTVAHHIQHKQHTKKPHAVAVGARISRSSWS